MAVTNTVLKRTRLVFLWTRVLGGPFWGMIYLLSMILYKNLHITPWQITVIIALKPLSALLAPYWSQIIHERPSRIVSNLIWANILRYLPFLFIPWINSPWIIITAFGIYMMFYRGVMPIWMEIIKSNLPEISRERLVGQGAILDYCSAAILPLGLGVILDYYPHAWSWFFFSTSLLGLTSSLLLYRIPILEKTPPPIHTPSIYLWDTLKKKMIAPWHTSWNLLKKRPDFTYFQVGFMLGGTGLMIIQPSLPIFFMDTLNLSYTKIVLALAMCKGIGFAVGTPFWVKRFRSWNIYFLSGLVTILASLSLFLLLSAQLNTLFLYVAYGIYGIMQSGSDLSWHMSGPHFAQDKESTPFSETNVLTVGIRGCIVPFIGSFIYSLTNSTGILIIGGVLCLFASWHLLKRTKDVPHVIQEL